MPMYKTPKNARTVSKKKSIGERKAARAKGRSLACCSDFFIEKKRVAYGLEYNQYELFLRSPEGGCVQSYCVWRVWLDRDDVLRQCFAMGLGAAQAQRLLRKSRNLALNPKLLRDAAILFSLGKQFDFEQAQALLRNLNVAPL